MNIYVERTGDWEGLRVLPLYLTRHAYVRGKINSLLSEEPGVDESARHEAYEAARKYYRQAWEYARGAELRQGRLILVCGLSGAGKSTVGRYLAKELPAVHIRSDAVRKHLGGISLDSRGEPSLYAPPMTARTYDRLLELGLLLAGEGFSVILDARYDRRANRLAAIERADSARIPLQIVHCNAAPQIRRQRLLNRRGDISDATAQFLEQQEQPFEEFAEGERPRVITHAASGAIDSGAVVPDEAFKDTLDNLLSHARQ
jgi:hypothetical protein